MVHCIAHSRCQWKLVFCQTCQQEFRVEDSEMLAVGGSALHISKQNTSIVTIHCSFAVPDVIDYLSNTLPLHIRVELQELIGRSDTFTLSRILRSSPSLRVVKLTYFYFTVGELRELCDMLLSTPNSLEVINIRNTHNDREEYGDVDNDYESYVTIEGAYQHTSVLAHVLISSLDDVTRTVSVLTEYSNLGLHLTSIRIWKPCERIKGDVACQLAEALHDTATLKTWILFDQHFGMKSAIAIGKVVYRMYVPNKMCYR